jgi:hypothetical protein
LETVKLGKNVEEIFMGLEDSYNYYRSAFNRCNRLKTIEVDENNKSYKFANGVLLSKDETELVLYPQGKEGTEYTTPASVKKIGDGAFKNLKGLTKITIGEGVTEIGNDAFYRCETLEEIILPNSLTIIGNYAFTSCDKLTGNITIPENVTTIGNYAFAYCNELAGSLTIPGNVKIIGDYAFSGCNKLTGLTIGDGVEEIGYCAFNYCGFTGSITIPASVNKIAQGAFGSCYNLSTIYMLHTDKESVELSKGDNGQDNWHGESWSNPPQVIWSNIQD